MKRYVIMCVDDGEVYGEYSSLQEALIAAASYLEENDQHTPIQVAVISHQVKLNKPKAAIEEVK